MKSNPKATPLHNGMTINAKHARDEFIETEIVAVISNLSPAFNTVDNFFQSPFFDLVFSSLK